MCELAKHRTGESRFSGQMKSKKFLQFISDSIENLHGTLQPNSSVFLSARSERIYLYSIQYWRLKAMLYLLFQIDVCKKGDLY